MAQLLVMYWKRLNSEIYEPLYQFRKSAIIKLESVQEFVFSKYDKLIKSATKLRELKVAAIAQWNELCDERHKLRKLRETAPDSHKCKKLSSRVKVMETKCQRAFESVEAAVDKFNGRQRTFWEEVIRSACLQLEAIEYSRISFYREYFEKYQDLLEWRRAELENGENTLKRARKMMMSPFEIAEFGIQPMFVEEHIFECIHISGFNPFSDWNLNEQIEKRVVRCGIGIDLKSAISVLIEGLNVEQFLLKNKSSMFSDSEETELTLSHSLIPFLCL